MIQAAALDDVDLSRDRDLVEAAQAGDPTAFAELYTRYFNRLVRFSVKRVGDTHEAEEIAQEAFARAYRALPSFGGERRFYPWMTVIAGRLCVDALRRRGRLEVGDVVDETFLETGFERLDRQGDIDKLNLAMLRLTDRHRQVLELRERQGWSYQHIADHLEVSLGTVEALLWRARKALRREFTSLGAAVLCLPGIRRFTTKPHSQSPTALAVVGSLGTAVALSLGTWGGVAAAGPAPQAAAPLSRLATSAVHDDAVMSMLSAVAASPAPPTHAAAASPATVARASRLPVHDSLAVVPVFMSHDAAAKQAKSSPIHVSTPTGGVIGLNPAAAVHNTVSYLGGSK